MNSRFFRFTPVEGLVIIVLGFVLLVSTAHSLRANSWQKRIDRALLQVDGVTPEGRFRSFQRALQDPELRTDVATAIEVVREKGFGKGHPEFIELLWPKGTQARRDLEAINALTKQLSERGNEVLQDNNSSSDSSQGGLLDVLQSTQKKMRFGEEGGSRAVLSSLLERVQSDPRSVQRLAGNVFRNSPVEVESLSYQLLGRYSSDEEEKVISNSDDEGEEEMEKNQKKSFLTIPALEIRQYDAFRSVSVPLRAPGSTSSSLDNNIYTLKNMGSALTEIFSFLELGNNAGSTLIPMTTPLLISDGDANKMFVKLPQNHEANPPKPIGSSRIAFDDVPETVMATLSFAGICTNEEIDRQKAKLMERIKATGDTGWKVRRQQISDIKGDDTENEDIEEESNEENEPEILVLQYNAPGTLPWRRMNEIAVVMEKTSSALNGKEDEIVDEAESESDQQKDSDEVIKDNSHDENASTTDPDVE
ncbi:hypothetical protein FRACYDRAFT_251182 [Fragilariopsis cylindrus CCMP1102]|uniref:Uncharacterized protein n=1 Tax=Fragilariopsis cylindrus CCMP1102 TaxID=635003 RepID=A0A1E7ENE1_9STRA|nr:hypothetical protein FRACYDRAFT_251182 [Fragilariopsis cylindrus CCMP1102]|eukprot:OEU07375.1 hypothetical protein FRACYDRAFT_251182 [Fragilariopsis cylindrus CCMP1102]